MEKKLVTLRQMETMALHRDGGMVADGTTLVEVMIRLLSKKTWNQKEIATLTWTAFLEFERLVHTAWKMM